ncbi:slowpoke-binding protein [Cardiocondyla obscurior]|uniref:slowpoke-binding protein n=1 Tax=Cardiocondyla obscurior TaxID=286306 RepID=UPI0039655BB1
MLNRDCESSHRAVTLTFLSFCKIFQSAMTQPNGHRDLLKNGKCLVDENIRVPTLISRPTPWSFRNLRRRKLSCNLFCSYHSSTSHPGNEQQLPKENLTTKFNSSNRNDRYTALHEIEYIEMETTIRNRGLLICQDYIKKTPHFTLNNQLNNIGSRLDKYWFTVKDTAKNVNKLLTFMPLYQNCPLSADSVTKVKLNKLFEALSHPYINFLVNVDFHKYMNQSYIVLIEHILPNSLKDRIYAIECNCWNENWILKYSARSQGLTLPEVRYLGRQILEALLFLREKGFPTVTNLHSGNVLIQSGSVRLANLENTLLKLTSRIHPIVTSELTETPIDIICFGHVLFEMCAGYELRTFRPSAVQLSEIEKYPQVVDVLQLIFTESENYITSLMELMRHNLFRNIELLELIGPKNVFNDLDFVTSVKSLIDDITQQNTKKESPNRKKMSRGLRASSKQECPSINADEKRDTDMSDEEAKEEKKEKMHPIREPEPSTSKSTELAWKVKRPMEYRMEKCFSEVATLKNEIKSIKCEIKNEMELQIRALRQEISTQLSISRGQNHMETPKRGSNITKKEPNLHQ